MTKEIKVRADIIAELSYEFELILRKIANKHNGISYAELVLGCAYLEADVLENLGGISVRTVLEK